MENNINKNDFSSGSIWQHIIALAGPMIIAQLVQLLYNIVDRIYIGHLPGTSSIALTGLGLTFPVITIIVAFTSLFGMGGAPLSAIARGRQDIRRAEAVMGNTFTMLCISGILLLGICYIFLKPLLYMFGASDDTFPYAREYLAVYLLGTPFVMIGAGMNGFISSQGFARIGMMTTLLGAVANIILDPVFIFLFHMGIAGAALATIISQLLSAVWVMRFLTGSRTLLHIRRSCLPPNLKLIKEIMTLGSAGFIMSATNGAVQITCNITLKKYGGDLYLGIMTVLISLRDLIALPVQGLSSASQPVFGFNYGAGKYRRIRQGIAFTTVTCVIYMLIAWFIVFMLPKPLIAIFNTDTALLEAGVPAIRIYFFGFFMMALQMAGQSVFVGLGQSKQAIFFSIFRKIIIVVPLTIILPYFNDLGVKGVFLAEPISNFLGGTACFVTMLFTIKRLFRNQNQD